MATPDGFRITQQVPGGEPLDLTREVTSCQWSSSVPGGFGSATLTIPRVLTQKERGLLGGVTIEHEGRVLFEGRVEDAFFKGSKTGLSTELSAFGLQRLLTDNSVHRAWSLRQSINPTTVSSVQGSSSAGVMTLSDQMVYVFGIYDTARPTLFGVRISGFANSPECGQVGIALPTGITGARIKCDAVIQNATTALVIHSTADGVTYTKATEIAGNITGNAVSVDVPLVDGAIEVRIALAKTGVATIFDNIEVSNIRILCTPLNEDAAGGFYGGTILRDIIPLAPGLYPGTIESGSDFAIAEVQRVSRTSLLDLVQQIAPLYAKEWAVWEGGRFDWITPDLQAGGWIVPLTEHTEWTIEQSIDSVHKRTYVTFTDAADNRVKEAFSDSQNARNPYVRTGTAKDGVVSAPAAMTSVTAPLLAAKLNNDFGRWPDIKGSVSLPAQTILQQAGNGSRSVPAFAIRAGDNITVPDLPVEDIYAAGQDGQTVFHVTGVQASTDGTVQLTLEGLTRRADVLLARIGAVSQ